jgi:hypothetical protein
MAFNLSFFVIVFMARRVIRQYLVIIAARSDSLWKMMHPAWIPGANEGFALFPAAGRETAPGREARVERA